MRLEWLQKCTSPEMEVHNVKVFSGRFSAGSHLLDPISGLSRAVAEQTVEEGHVRVRKAHHRNA
jgi:hypothetical protein